MRIQPNDEENKLALSSKRPFCSQNILNISQHSIYSPIETIKYVVKISADCEQSGQLLGTECNNNADTVSDSLRFIKSESMSNN